MLEDHRNPASASAVLEESDPRALVLADRYRPAYHFTSPSGWLNDPNGVSQWNGEYHLFYQYNPYSADHRLIHWGHAVSTDLVRWADRPIALTPSEGPDEEGCWSGVLVEDRGRPVIVYSGHAHGRQTACLAYGDATLTTWTKESGNPVIEPPQGVALTAFRDHCVWRENGVWRQLIGSGIRGEGGTAFLYESEDLVSWRLIGPLATGEAAALPDTDPLWTGTMWECVDFFRLGADGTTGAPDSASDDEHVLLFSAWDDNRTMHPLAAIGRYAGDRFAIDRYQRLDLGGRHAYAPQTFADESGRRVLWSWMQEARGGAAQRAAGWSGAMALPRVLTIDDIGVIRQEPVPELDAARGERLTWTREQGAVASAGDQIEFDLDASVPAGSAVTIEMLATPDGTEKTVAVVGRDADGELTLTVDRARSSLGEDRDMSMHSGAVPAEHDHVRVRGFLDRSSLEIFVDGIALTTRVYPTRADAVGIRVLAGGGAALARIDGWRMLGQEQEVRLSGAAGSEEDGHDR